jgi:hypothetical protein
MDRLASGGAERVELYRKVVTNTLLHDRNINNFVYFLKRVVHFNLWWGKLADYP